MARTILAKNKGVMKHFSELTNFAWIEPKKNEVRAKLCDLKTTE